jgi:long-subunit acyl-CoA synthetase (AMP-forming)
MIAHRNVIANIMQIRWHEEVGRRQKGVETQTIVGLLPFSHIYALVVVTNAGIYRGDGVVVLPRYELKTLLESIQRFKINFLHIVRATLNTLYCIALASQKNIMRAFAAYFAASLYVNIHLHRSHQSSSNSCATQTYAPSTTSAACASSTRARPP